MIGTAVTKGYANSKPDKRDDTTVTNITDSVSGAAGSESMSQEELSIRLSYALSLTFVVGILQVSQYFPFLSINVNVFNQGGSNLKLLISLPKGITSQELILESEQMQNKCIPTGEAPNLEACMLFARAFCYVRLGAEPCRGIHLPF